MTLCALLGIDEPEVVQEDVVVRETKLSPFDFVNSIYYDKKDLFSDNENADSQYLTYIVNRALSFNPDTVLYANEMNRYRDLPKKVQFEFLKTAIRKRKRNGVWMKAEEESEQMKIVKEYYGYSNEKAKQAITLLMPSDIDELKSRMSVGGMKTKPKKSRKDL